MILEENMWLKTQKLLPKEQKLPPITWNINKEVWLWWFLGAIPTQCWNSRLLLQKRHIRRISISKKQMGSSKNKRKSNSLIEKFASCNQWTWWLLRLSLIVCIWNDEFVSAWQSAEFWRNALGRPPCWTKTASLSTGALICTPTLCGIFWIIYLLLSITSTSFFGPVSQTFACTHSMAPSAFAFALRFQLSEYQHVPDPFTHSFFTFGTCLWTFKTLILVRSIKSSSNKQRRLCISWQTNNHAQQSFASATWWNKMEKVAELSLLTIN